MRLLHFCLLIALGHGAATAQSARTCRILFLAPAADAPKNIFLNDGKTTQEVELPTLNFSDPYPLASGDLTLRLLSKPPEKDQPPPAEAPGAKVAAATRDLYLLVASDPDNKVAPLRLQVVEANPDKFRKGQSMWFNLTPHAVGGKQGDRTVDLKPNSRAIIDAPVSGFEDYPVKIGYQPADGKPVKSICSGVWRHDPTARNVIFVVLPPNARTPQVKGFIDTRFEGQPKQP